jgi:hypothetical protein
MPCSQMMRTNCRPPRPSDAVRFAMLPQVNDRIRNSDSRNSGLSTFISMTTNATSTARPPIRQESTIGLPQPVGEEP